MQSRHPDFDNKTLRIMASIVENEYCSMYGVFNGSRVSSNMIVLSYEGQEAYAKLRAIYPSLMGNITPSFFIQSLEFGEI